MDRDTEPGDKLRGSEAFSAERSSAAIRRECGIERRADEVGRESLSVRRRIRSSCAGWVERPTAGEFYDAVRAEDRPRDSGNLITMWVQEASDAEMALAWAEEAYTFRELVAAIERAGATQIEPGTQR